MTTLRRFLTIQALMLWQGGFLFYAGVVVPTGTSVLGPFAQGRVTRHVTDAMNIVGVVALLVLAWDQRRTRAGRRSRWLLWLVLALCLACLALLHVRIETHVNFAVDGSVVDYPTFYLWHRVYLWLAALQWVVGLSYVATTVHSWRNA